MFPFLNNHFHNTYSIMKTSRLTLPLLLILFVFPLEYCFNKHKNQAISTASQGRLEHIKNFPSEYIAERNVDIWLPEDYNENKKYAVLYMHDGQMLFDSTITWNQQEWGVDETFQKLMDSGNIEPTIVVGIWNISKSRNSDYFPQKPFEYLLKNTEDSLLQRVRKSEARDLFTNGVHSDDYLRFIVHELMPYVDSAYSTYNDSKHTYIAGSSMGGLISLYAVCEYPGIFGGAACLSTHWPGIHPIKNNPVPESFFHYLDHNLPKSTGHTFYFDHGTQTLDTLYPPLQAQVDSIMKKHRYSHQNWQTKVFKGEAHDEHSWNKRLHIPIKFLLGKEKPEH